MTVFTPVQLNPMQQNHSPVLFLLIKRTFDNLVSAIRFNRHTIKTMPADGEIYRRLVPSRKNRQQDAVPIWRLTARRLTTP